MPVQEVRVHELAELQRALKKLGSEEAKELDRELIAGADIVKMEATNRFSMIDATEAAGFRSRSTGFGRVVVQRQRSKHRRGDFGSLLMRRVLLPARAEKSQEILDHVDRMIGRLAGEGGF